MADGFRNSSGVDASELYDPDVIGDGYDATWLRRTDGTTLKYALARYGTPGPVLGQRDSGGADAGPKWAAKGTASYALAFDGQTYTANAAARGHAQLDLNMKSDGTWTIIRSGTSIITATLASGTWLPSGDSVSDYTVQFVATQSGSVVAGGTNSVSNGASAASALTTTRKLSAMSDAPLTSDRANATTGVTVKLFKSGSLISTTLVTLQTNANGN